MIFTKISFEHKFKNVFDINEDLQKIKLNKNLRKQI